MDTSLVLGSCRGVLLVAAVVSIVLFGGYTTLSSNNLDVVEFPFIEQISLEVRQINSVLNNHADDLPTPTAAPTATAISAIAPPVLTDLPTLPPHNSFATLAPPRKLPEWCAEKGTNTSPIKVANWINSWTDVGTSNAGCELRCVYVGGDLKGGDVVIYFPYGNSAIPELESRQVLAAWAREPQQFTGYDANLWQNVLLRGKVDFAMTYNLDSNIPVNYMRSNFVERAYGHPIPTRENFEQRKTAVWISSNCDSTAYSRPKVVQILQRYIQVDCLGKCLNNAPKWEPRSSTAPQFYKLFFGFEKSIDEEYISEKFIDPFAANGLVVYIGSSRAKIYAPSNHSYIDALKFANASALGEYLKKVVNDYDEWVSYFQWKKDPVPQRLLDLSQFEEDKPHICRVCDCVCNATCNNGFRPGNGLERNVYSAKFVNEVWSV